MAHLDGSFVLFSSVGGGGAKTVFDDPSSSLAVMADYVLGEGDSCGCWGSFSPASKFADLRSGTTSGGSRAW